MRPLSFFQMLVFAAMKNDAQDSTQSHRDNFSVGSNLLRHAPLHLIISAYWYRFPYYGISISIILKMTTILVAVAVMTAMSAAVHHTVDTESLREKVAELERYVSELERTLDPEIDNRPIFYCVVSLVIIFGYRHIDTISAVLGMLTGVMKDIWLLARLAFASHT